MNVVPRRAFVGSFIPRVAVELTQLIQEKNYTSGVFLTWKECRKLGLQVPKKAKMIDFSPSLSLLVNVCEFSDPSSVLACVDSNSMHFRLFRGPLSRAVHPTLETFCVRNNIQSPLWLSSADAKECSFDLLPSAPFVFVNGVQLYSVDHTEFKVRLTSQAWRWYTPRGIVRCFNKTVKAWAEAVYWRKFRSEWWGTAQDFSCFGVSILPWGKGIALDVGSCDEYFNADETDCPLFVPPWARAHNVNPSSLEPLAVTIRGVTFPREIATKLAAIGEQKGYKSNVWMTPAEIGASGMRLKANATLVDVGRAFYNKEEVDYKNINQQQEFLSSLSQSTFTGKLIMGNEHLRTMMQQRGFKNSFFGCLQQLQIFDVSLLPTARGVLLPYTMDVFFNARETTNPEAMNYSSCRSWAPRNIDSRRFEAPLKWLLRRHAIKTGEWSEYWATKMQWNCLLNDQISFFGVPFVWDGCELYSNNQLHGWEHRSVVDAIYRRLSQKPVWIRDGFEMKLLPAALTSNLGCVSNFWLTRRMAENTLGIKVHPSTTWIKFQGEILFNTSGTSRPDLFSFEAVRPVSFLTRLGFSVFNLSSRSFAMICRQWIKHRFRSPYWLTEEQCIAQGLHFPINPKGTVSVKWGEFCNADQFDNLSSRYGCSISDIAHAPITKVRSVDKTTLRWELLFQAYIFDHLNSKFPFGTLLSLTYCDLCMCKVSSLIHHRLGFCANELYARTQRHNFVLQELYEGLRAFAKGELTDIFCDLPQLSKAILKRWQTGHFRPDLCFKLNGTPFVIELTVPFFVTSRLNMPSFSKRRKYESACLKSSEGKRCRIVCMEVSAFGQMSCSCLVLDELMSTEDARKTRLAMQKAAVEGSTRICRGICTNVESNMLDSQQLSTTHFPKVPQF